MNIQTVGVVGAGVMGVGVAHSLAQTGHKVILVNISDAILEHSREEITKNIRLQRIWSKKAAQETITTTKALLATMGKEGIVVNDMPGFVSNRVLTLTVNEAVYLVQDQVTTVEEVDRIFKSCFGHPMGPLETADLIGLDTILYSVEVLYESYNDSKYRPCPLLKKMVDAGLYGCKSGQGFYIY